MNWRWPVEESPPKVPRSIADVPEFGVKIEAIERICLDEGRYGFGSQYDIEFDVGPDAAKWVKKILNPPDRPKKLGLKAEMKAWVGTGFDSVFKKELKTAKLSIVNDLSMCEIAFCLVDHRDELKQTAKLFQQIPDGVNVRIVWPRGVDEIRQSDVMDAAASWNFGPSKTAAFDDRLSSLRFARKRAN